VRVPPDREDSLDGRSQRTEVVRQVGSAEVRAHPRHPAADVDAHGGRRHGVAHGDDRADRRALAEVDVRHDTQPVDPRQATDVAQLVESGGLDEGGVCPHQG
jgi:hypothetical protein